MSAMYNYRDDQSAVDQNKYKKSESLENFSEFDTKTFSQFFVLEHSSNQIEYVSMISQTYFAAISRHLKPLEKNQLF